MASNPAQQGDPRNLPDFVQSDDPLRQLPALAELSQTFARSLDIDETLENAVWHIIDAMDAEAASVFLRDAEGQALECRASAGPVDVRGLRVPAGDGIVGRATADNACQLVRDARSESDLARRTDADTGFTTRSMVCAPLHSGDQTIGALQVLNKTGGRFFDTRDRDLLRVLASPISLALHNAELARDLAHQERIREELELARGIQRSLLPADPPGDFPFAAKTEPAREVSGDFYDFFRLGDGRVGFTVGDVAGKGVDAALLMARTTSLLRIVGKLGHPPAEWLATVNDELSETISRGRFVCAAAGYYDPSTDTLTWANAGFPPPVAREADGSFADYPAEAPPLGVVPGQTFPEQTRRLHNAAVFFFSDGVIEARDANGDELGLAGTRRLAERFAGLAPARRTAAMVDAVRGNAPRDDTTLLLLDVSAPPARELARRSFAAAAENLAEARAAVAEACRATGLDEAASRNLQLAVDEACANIIRHGYKDGASGVIELSVHREGDALVLRLRDDAEPVDASSLRPRDLDEARPGGLGIHFIDQIMDRREFLRPADGRGNLLEMTKILHAPSHEPN